jgi:hypothetical protein
MVSMLAWSLVLGAVWCGAYAAAFELLWFRISRTMVYVVLRHVRRNGRYTVSVANTKKLWLPGMHGRRGLVSGPGEATYSRSGDQVVLELLRPGIDGGAERFEGPALDLSSKQATPDAPAQGNIVRGLRVYRVCLEVVPAVGWVTGALAGRGAGLELLTCWFGWMIASFLTIGTMWMTLGAAAFRRLRTS